MSMTRRMRSYRRENSCRRDLLTHVPPTALLGVNCQLALYLESSFFLLNFFLKKSREQALSRGNEGAIEGFCDNNPLEAASAAVEAGRVHSRPMSELEVRDRFMALPTRPSAALYAPMKLFV